MVRRKTIMAKEAAAKIVEADKDITAAKKILVESAASLKKSTANCAAQKTDFKTLSEDKEKEIKGLTKAVGLIQKVKMPAKKSLLQHMQKE